MSKHRQYPVRIPRYANGIRMQELRSGFACGWWAMQWQRKIEEMGFLGRFGRAKKYAAGGQVIELQFDEAGVRAKVMGTRSVPYEVTIKFRKPDGASRRAIIEGLRAKPILVARMLAGEMPVEVEELFKANGCDLLPGGKLKPGVYDVTTHCACPDYANPCKHSLGVLILLGEEIANRPLMLLKLRGIDIDEVVV